MPALVHPTHRKEVLAIRATEVRTILVLTILALPIRIRITLIADIHSSVPTARPRARTLRRRKRPRGATLHRRVRTLHRRVRTLHHRIRTPRRPRHRVRIRLQAARTLHSPPLQYRI